MVARLGNVIYWAGCGIAVLVLVFGGYLSINEHDLIYFVIGFAVLSFLIGKAARYILAGK